MPFLAEAIRSIIAAVPASLWPTNDSDRTRRPENDVATDRVGIHVGNRLSAFVVVVVGSVVVGALAGVAATVFLVGLDRVTGWREARATWMVPLLPLAAAAWLEVVSRLSARTNGGTTVVLEVAQRGGERIPLGLGLLALVGTWWAHLWGGSVGREGTAVQMGAAWADAVVQLARRWFTVNDEVRRRLVVAGIAGGFGGVFGTPVAGAVFGIEVVVARRLDGRSALPAIVAAVVGDVIGEWLLGAFGGAHGHFPSLPALSMTHLWRVVVLGVVVGFVGRLFIVAVRSIKQVAAVHPPWRRGLVGGGVVVALWALVPGGAELIGLSLPTLMAAVNGDVEAVVPWAFLLKLLLTAVCVGIGLVGGEVTPLCVIGATVGLVAAGPLGLPAAHAACAAMAAMCGACLTTPLALWVMIVELCGPGAWALFGICIVVASAVVGRASVYTRAVGRAASEKGRLFFS
jgi:H+/Cl- antiporter ClcA